VRPASRVEEVSDDRRGEDHRNEGRALRSGECPVPHASGGGHTIQEYIGNAEEAGDQELAEFLRQVQEDDQSRAELAKKLLLARLG
jgi:hypothetical protein